MMLGRLRSRRATAGAPPDGVGAAPLGTDRSGAAAIEFALIAPILCLLLVGVVDYGGALFTKFNLDGPVTSAANYGLQNADNVASSTAAALATQMASIVASSHSSTWANATVVVNNGPSATITAGVVASSGTAANADNCYCPTTNATVISWGSAMTCGATCTGNGVAGKFITIVGTKVYKPWFGSYGIVKNNTISSRAVLETQ